MTPENTRPDPEALLANLATEERKVGRGRLKIFLGMCPGVGKTFNMLRAGRKELSDGVDVLVGIVETHGRHETESLLHDLPIQPRRNVDYRGTRLAEFDIDGLLARRPKIALIDELAHSNAPGSRHAKRWQDVTELLEAGIDVFSTLNIQHVESRAEAVRQITGVNIHETVPDRVLDLADELELVDITPETLRERMEEGKVYLGEQAAAAARGFFQESHLNALREMALRYTAERVERELRHIRSSQARHTVWRSGERLLVAVGPSPFSTQLVRWTRRLAAAQGAAWSAVTVEGNVPNSPESRQRLDKNLALARELGAEIVVTQDEDVARALVRVALQQNATQIVVGRSLRPSMWEWVRGGSIVDRLLRLGGNIDIYVVPTAGEGIRSRDTPLIRPVGPIPWPEYQWVLGSCASITLLGSLFPERYYLLVGLIYLLAVVFLSLRIGRWPLLLAGVLGAVLWNYFFIPPRFTFAINRPEDGILFITYFVVSLVSGQLTARIRAQAEGEHKREERATALFTLTRHLATTTSFDHALEAAIRQVETLFSARCALLIIQDDDTLQVHHAGSQAPDEREMAIASWSARNRQPAGRYTDTMPGGSAYHVPLLRNLEALGVLVVYPGPNTHLSLAQRDLLEAFTRMLAITVEKEKLRRAGEREKSLAESDRLHRVLLDSVSHELRTPLAVIGGSLDQLATGLPEQKKLLLNDALTATHRLNRLVDNLLDQTRLESGHLKPHLDWCDAGDLINSSFDAVRDSLIEHRVEISLPPDLPPVRLDFQLTEQAVANLLLNVARHTPTGTQVFVTAGLSMPGPRFYLTVADNGPGLPDSLKDRLFQKFARGDASRAGSMGLGLSIVRGFIVAQGGEVVVGGQPEHGAVFTIYLPQPEKTPGLPT